MTSPPPTNTWWRRLSLAPPEDVNADHFRSLRQRGFTRQEAHAALCEAGPDIDAAFHAAIRLRHKTHTGSPYLYSGCDLCDEEKLKYAARRAQVQARRESIPTDREINVRKAEAVEKWRKRNPSISSPPSSPKSAARCIRWCCPRESCDLHHGEHNSFEHQPFEHQPFAAASPPPFCVSPPPEKLEAC